MESKLKKRKLFIWLPAVFCLLLGLVIFDKIQLFGGDGQVLDSSSKQPVNGATVDLDCRRSQFHGSKTVRKVTKISDINGRYKFSLFNLLGCDFAFVRVSKKGYIASSALHTGYDYSNYRKIPKALYVTKESDAVMLRLQAITPDREADVHPQHKSNYYYSDYREWYKKFVEAMNIAQTHKERKFVREHYCASLKKLYSALEEKEKSYLSEMVFGYRWLGEGKQIKHDYESITKYCGN